MTETDRFFDVAVVGGGLGGLATAALVARRGLDVVVLERAAELGGRAATHVRDGFHFNLGAHALYAGGAAARVLRELGVRWTGQRPRAGGVAELDGHAYGLPLTASSLLTTGLLGWSAKAQGGRLMARVPSLDARGLAGISLSSWLGGQVADATMRATIEALVRVTTYTNAPSLLDAGATVAQLQLGQKPGVVYLDGGWQTLVDGAAAAARAAGAELRTAARVACAAACERGWQLGLEGTAPLGCRAVVLATGPSAARSIVPSETLAAWADRCVPLRAACLDLALARLPRDRPTFALGVDRPLYYSVHTASARLAPKGAALVSLMKYLRPTEPADPAGDAAELEAWMDRLQPGWREVLVERRWLPGMIASNALVTAASGGLRGRPGPRVPDAPGVFVVGDWVGPEGMLLDAALASAAQAATQIGEALAPQARPKGGRAAEGGGATRGVGACAA
jgi:phytoene dehydrogenase-like protein